MLSFVLSTVLAAAPSPESQGVSSRGLTAWIEACERELDAMHGFVLVRHGKVVAEGSWMPYDTLNETHRLYSHSKSFTSTAVGFLVDDGKLDLDERVVDILPDKAPAVQSDNLKALRVRDLLTMNVGASKTDAERNDSDGDWERAFLANEIDIRPGLRFKYDSGATYLLSAIVGRKTGRSLMEVLKERLFDRIGIASAWSTTSPGGTPCGGWGMNMTTRELALFGQFYLNRGVWDGERVLSDEWVTLATARQTWSGPIGVTGEDGSDWHQGYGFQFWRCRHGCYRADGANGQYTIVFPAHDAVLSIHAGLDDMQQELDLVWKYILPAFASAPLPEDASAAGDLRARCARLSLPCVYGSHEGSERYCGVDFRMTNVVQTVSKIRLDRTDAGWNLSLTTAAGVQVVPIGFREWVRGKLKFTSCLHEGLGDIVGEQRVASSAAVQEDGSLKIRVLFLGGPQKLDLSFSCEDGVPSVRGCLHGIGGGVLAGERMILTL